MSLLFSVLLLIPAQAQILNRIMREAKRDVQRNVENMVVEKATEAIVRAAMRPIEDTFDQMLKESYKEDSTRRANEPVYADTSSFDYNSFMEYLTQLNNTVELPESYDFVWSMDVLMEHGKERNEFTWHFSENGRQLAMEQTDKKGRSNIIVMDFERNINALYAEEKNGEKSVQAFPSMNKLILSMMKEGETDPVTIQKTENQKTVAGYRCLEYKVLSSDEEITSYVAPDFPVSWDKSYGEVLAQYAPENARKEYVQIEGMVLESISIQKDSKEEPIRMTTLKVTREGMTIDNSQYEAASLSGEN